MEYAFLHQGSFPFLPVPSSLPGSHVPGSQFSEDWKGGGWGVGVWGAYRGEGALGRAGMTLVELRGPWEGHGTPAGRDVPGIWAPGPYRRVRGGDGG